MQTDCVWYKCQALEGSSVACSWSARGGIPAGAPFFLSTWLRLQPQRKLLEACGVTLCQAAELVVQQGRAGARRLCLG